jgi:hypothetical protein
MTDTASPIPKKSSAQHRYHDRCLWQWAAFCALGLLTLALGFIGFLRTAALHGKAFFPLDALYESMSLPIEASVAGLY